MLLLQAYWRATVPPVKAINPIGIPRQKNSKPDPNSSPSLRREQTVTDNGLPASKGLSSKGGTPIGSGHGGPGSIHGGPGSVHGGSVHGGSVHGSGWCLIFHS